MGFQRATARSASQPLKDSSFPPIRRGLLLLTGEPGSGKTSVLRRLVNGLNPQTHLHCYTPHATVSRTELYRQINQLLRLPPRIKKCDLFEQIQRAVTELHENQGKTPCFILDEAHLMDHETLTELILITNFQMDSKVPFILVLIGQPDLRDKLKRRMHEPLNQRITLRYHMAGLSADESRTYVQHHLKISGRTDPLLVLLPRRDFETATFDELEDHIVERLEKISEPINFHIAEQILILWHVVSDPRRGLNHAVGIDKSTIGLFTPRCSARDSGVNKSSAPRSNN